MNNNRNKQSNKKQSVSGTNHLMLPTFADSKVGTTSTTTTYQPYRRPSIFDFVDLVNEETNVQGENPVYLNSSNSCNISIDMNNNYIDVNNNNTIKEKTIPMFHIETVQDQDGEIGEQTSCAIINDEDESINKS
jgi:hypothetical protein